MRQEGNGNRNKVSKRIVSSALRKNGVGQIDTSVRLWWRAEVRRANLTKRYRTSLF